MPTQPATAGTLTRETSAYLNRELSWIDFNARVLALSRDPAQALLERVKFCAIFASNLDEFFGVRIAGIQDQVAAGVTQQSIDGVLPGDQLRIVTETIRALTVKHAASFADLVPQLRAAGVIIASWDELSEDDQAALTVVFEEGIFPVLTPLAVVITGGLVTSTITSLLFIPIILNRLKERI